MPPLGKLSGRGKLLMVFAEAQAFVINDDRGRFYPAVRHALIHCRNGYRRRRKIDPGNKGSISLAVGVITVRVRLATECCLYQGTGLAIPGDFA